jgi:hypothetical protein
MKMPEPGYQQAGIEIQDKARFEELQTALQRIFSPALVERFLRKLESKNIRIRNFETVLERKVIEQVDEVLGRAGKSARDLYQGLPVADQGQMREFYLTSLEAVDQVTRERFAPIYRYY